MNDIVQEKLRMEKGGGGERPNTVEQFFLKLNHPYITNSHQ